MPKLSADKIEFIPVKENNFKIIKLTNFKIEPDFAISNEVIKFSGKSFLGFYHNHFHHFIIDAPGQYEYLKTYVGEDLNIYFAEVYTNPTWRKDNRNCKDFFSFLKTTHFSMDIPEIDGLKIEQHKYFEDIFNMYSKSEDIYAIKADTLFFEEFYYMLDDFRVFSDDFLISMGATGNDVMWLNDDYNLYDIATLMKYDKMSWETSCLPLLKNKFKNYSEDSLKYNKKIYISRQLANKRYQVEKEKNMYTHTDKNLKERFFEKEDIVEKFFNDNGYVSVYLEGLPFIEQINIFYNATHVAGLSGSGFLNCISCKDDAIIYEVRAIEAFGYSYESYLTSMNLNYVQIDIRGPEEILSVLEHNVK